MSTFNVSNVSGLSAALQSAHAGDTIKLASGVYSQPVISNLTFSSAITITSADPLHQAVLAGLGVSNVVGVNFTNLELTSVGAKADYYAFRVQNSANISFSNIHAHGDTTIAPSLQESGFYVTASKNVSFNNDVIDHLGAGIIANNDDFIQIKNTSFSYLNKGGIEMGGSSDVSIANNNFTDFEVSQGTHPDAIQLYSAGMTQAGHDISITGNLIDRGSGDAVQGIFVQDETGVLPYHNVTIANNTVLGGMWDSLYVNGATGNIQVTNNYVASWAGIDKEGSGTSSAALTAATVTGFAGYIWLQNLTGATLTETGNTAQAYLGNSGKPMATTGNTMIGQISPESAAALPLANITAVAQKFAGNGFNLVSGNALTGDVGDGVFLESVAASGRSSQLVSATGTSFAGKYGTLTIAADGSFTYAANISATVGVSYDDQFTLTVGSAGKATSTTLDVISTSTGAGDGKVDYITGGAAASGISAFGTGSQLTSGAGADTFVFGSIAQSTLANETLIKGFKSGDLIDLSAIASNFKIVSKFDGHADELVLAHLGNGNWQIQGDTTGAGTANFAIHLLNATVSNLTAANFKFSASAASAVGIMAAVVATKPLAVVAETFSGNGYGQISGSVLSGDSGDGVYVSSIGIGSAAAKAVSPAGTTFAGKYGALTVSSDGDFTYSEAVSPTVGVSYDDHFTMTVFDSNGKSKTTTLDIVLTSNGIGDGKVDYIVGGAAASKISSFGAGSQLVSGVGADTFVFNNIAQSTLANETLINGFKSGDIIDLSAIDPSFKIVSRFDGRPDELILAHMGTGNWQILGDTTGSGQANFEIHLLHASVANLTAANFHL